MPFISQVELALQLENMTVTTVQEEPAFFYDRQSNKHKCECSENSKSLLAFVIHTLGIYL